MYGSIVLSLLFWGYANEICSVDEAKRFYPLLNLTGNTSLVFLGILLAAGNETLKQKKDLLLQISLAIVIILGIIVLLIYRWMQTNVLTDPELYSAEKIKKRNAKPKMGMGESLRFVFSSGYVAKIAAMLICYGACVNFIEIFYKNMLNLYWMRSTMNGMSIESGVMGLMVILLSLFVGTTAVSRFGWTRTALATPACFTLFGLPFLAIQLGYAPRLLRLMTILNDIKKEAGSSLEPIINEGGYELVLPIYAFGLVSIICAKSFKYFHGCLFSYI